MGSAIDPAVGPPQRLDRLNWTEIERRLGQHQDDQERARHPERHLCCAQCGKAITREEQRIAVQGGHEHRFSNPHGYTFHIGCFAAAAGCAQTGPWVAEWSWFQGYLWQIALCRECGVHLGWRYRHSDGDAFYGLILKHLVSAEDRR